MSHYKEILILLYLRFAYIIARIRIFLYSIHHPIRVLFFVSEVAKWKSQHLYDLLVKDERYTPIICVYPMMCEKDLESATVEDAINRRTEFFKKKGMNVISIWNAKNNCFDLNAFNEPGFIFYQQPWDVHYEISPIKVAFRHLTFYMPYYLMNQYCKELALDQPLHRHVFRYVVQNKAVVDFCYSVVKPYNFAGRIIGLGHISTDGYDKIQRTNNEFTAIYAPHFSFPVNNDSRPVFYSTFLDNGELILDFAKQHPEIKWIFKPHPRLRRELENTGVWNKDKIDEYFDEWERIGQTCYTSDYQTLFVNSDIMLTDCGSFLSEYSCTKKPILRMMSPYLNVMPNPVLQKLYSTYYVSHNNDELLELMHELLIERNDPNKEIRESAIAEVGFCDTVASDTYCAYLNRFISKKF